MATKKAVLEEKIILVFAPTTQNIKRNFPFNLYVF